MELLFHEGPIFRCTYYSAQLSCTSQFFIWSNKNCDLRRVLECKSTNTRVSIGYLGLILLQVKVREQNAMSYQNVHAPEVIQLSGCIFLKYVFELCKATKLSIYIFRLANKP